MERINIAEILKYCPKGTELYSPICGECKLLKIYIGLGFDVINETGDVFNFSYDGRYNLNGECLIFPSKDQRDWNKFRIPFKDGDVVCVNLRPEGDWVGIFKKYNQNTFSSYCFINGDLEFVIEHNRCSNHSINVHLATEKEKEKLFKAIKANGYKWNAKTKTLEKLIEPKFKVGDRIKYANTEHIRIVKEIEYDRYILDNNNYLKFCNEHAYKLVKFDISTLNPFDKVLVRLNNDNQWYVTLFSHIDGIHESYGRDYVTVAGKSYTQMIPYKGNEHLLGTIDDCDEYYKTWE